MKLFYCPICGKVQFPLNSNRIVPCIGCGKTVGLIESSQDYLYYKNKSSELFGNTSNWQNVLLDEEISKNPHFQKNMLGITISREEYLRAMQAFNGNTSQQLPQTNKPKCPTCQSTNIKKISVTKKVTHGLMFGILSKTAFSQFECCNCGYKW